MKALSLTDELVKVAERVIWFEKPEEALTDPIRFVTYAMTYGTHEDMKVIKQYLSDDDLREVLAKAPPGIFDPRSWAYWHLKLGQYPPPPQPIRRFE
ncbi:hypothetical protein [Nitrospira sp. M1]|nr:MAG: hypothetical protein NPIRA01_07310 [Nitrospirales bacterium]